MISKTDRQGILNMFTSKEDKMFISNIIDKCNKSEALSKIIATQFLDLNEVDIAIRCLNRCKQECVLYYINEYCEKGIILFLPEYMSIEDIDYSDYITCIKITPKNMSKLKHKDFMGSIYNIGIKNECIGDIFLNDKSGYVFFTKSIERFVLENLFKVSNQEVECEIVPLNSKEVLELKVEYINKSYIIPSMRIDALLSEVYNLSRKEVKDKIVSGDLYINSKLCINPSEEFFEDDIVSFKRCGKFKVGGLLRTTKNQNKVISVNKYA